MVLWDTHHRFPLLRSVPPLIMIYTLTINPKTPSQFLCCQQAHSCTNTKRHPNISHKYATSHPGSPSPNPKDPIILYGIINAQSKNAEVEMICFIPGRLSKYLHHTPRPPKTTSTC